MLRGENLGKRFGSRIVLRNLSFCVERGQIAAVVGPNGAGKSTLLKIVAGLVAPSAGHIHCDIPGEAPNWCGLSAPDAPLPRELTAHENLEFIARLRGLPSTTPDAHLEHWHLHPRRHDLTGELSSGLRTRLQLAAATLHEPCVLLLDEPSANLDEAGRDLLKQLLLQQRGHGLALLATNDEREAALCDIRIDVRA